MKTNSVLSVILVTTSIAFGSQVIPAQAFSINFVNKTNNGNTNIASKFNVQITDNSNNKIKFHFTNSDANASITQIWFGKIVNQFNTFADYFSAANYTLNGSPAPVGNSKSGVEFENSNSNPPSGNFGWSSALSFDATSKGFHQLGIDGINNESLDIVLNLVGNKTLSQVENAFKSGTLAIGLHAQSIGGSGGFSDKFESQYQSESVPEPFTILGTVTAFGFGSLFKRKYSKKDNAVKTIA